MSLDKYIKEKKEINYTYQKFKEKNHLDFENEKIDVYNKKNNLIFKSKPFKLSIALTILLLIISMTIIGVNYINKPKYQEYHFTEEELANFQFLGASDGHNYSPIIDSCHYRGQFESCCSLYRGKITNEYYIVGYLDEDKLNDKIFDDRCKETTWYVFNEKNAPYRIKNKISWLTIKYLEITYTEDLSTGYKFKKPLIEKNYLLCVQDINEDENIIYYQEREYTCADINDEFINRHGYSKMKNEEDEKEVNSYINGPVNTFIRYANFRYSNIRMSINRDYFNLITINDKTYMQVDLYEINNGEKQELNYIKKWGEFGEQLTKTKKGEIVSEDGKYIMGLYPLEEVVKLVQNIK